MRKIRILIIYFVLTVLLWWALRNAPLQQIWNTLSQLQPWQVLLLLSLNVLVIALMTARWWIIVRAENRRGPFLPLTGYRLSAFGVSYFTLGRRWAGNHCR